MRHALLLLFIMLSGCSGARLSSDEARKKITEIGSSGLIPESVEIRRVVSQNDTEVIAETTVALAFQFRRTNASTPWRVAAVRLGDRDWISLDELLAAINEGRRRETIAAMEKLAAGIANYRRSNGTIPVAADIVVLTDMLHPQYMSDLVRTDGWGHPIRYQVAGATYRMTSDGPDGVQGSSDDIVLPD